MELHYLLFDASDEESGRGSFDAMASVTPDRLGALLAEVAAVLRWATQGFGSPGESPEEAEWQLDLQAWAEPGTPLAIGYDAAGGQLVLEPVGAGARVTVTLTISGSAQFRSAFAASFGD